MNRTEHQRDSVLMLVEQTVCDDDEDLMDRYKDSGLFASCNDSQIGQDDDSGTMSQSMEDAPGPAGSNEDARLSLSVNK